MWRDSETEQDWTFLNFTEIADQIATLATPAQVPTPVREVNWTTFDQRLKSRTFETLGPANEPLVMLNRVVFCGTCT